MKTGTFEMSPYVGVDGPATKAPVAACLKAGGAYSAIPTGAKGAHDRKAHREGSGQKNAGRNPGGSGMKGKEKGGAY